MDRGEGIMSSVTVFGSLLFTTFFLCFLKKFAAEMIPDLLENFCGNSANFTASSDYLTGLRTVLSNLSTADPGVFYNATAGKNTDRVYAIFMCRGDLGGGDCGDCAALAASEALKLCPNQKEAVFWFDRCMLRYSPRNIFQKPETHPRFHLGSRRNLSTDQVRPPFQLVLSMMNETRNVAISSPDNFGEMRYFLAQCTDDLTSDQCNRCLEVAIGWLPACCRAEIGVRVLLPSCNIKFDLYNFVRGRDKNSPGSKSKGNGQLHKTAVIAISLSVSVLAAVVMSGYYLIGRRRQKREHRHIPDNTVDENIITIESLQFDFSAVKAATDNFSDRNRLGAGGFGVVFKGKLPRGQEIAVKKLSRSSNQGVQEFKNEVAILAKLQHKNLVRLMGFCLEGEEKMLIYEFVSKKSLDYSLFDSEKQGQLDWPSRYKIIKGIVRGILYLHQDSRLTIIHRDLKTSNILLDDDMNAKISDFGSARIFDIQQDQGNTRRIVGTYGYMSPEYAMHGSFSMKSDIYSFGVILLEIISGKKNSTFYQSNDADDLVSYAWRLWKIRQPLQLMDPSLEGSYNRDEVIRCIHIGLLCIEENPINRPSIVKVASALNNYSITLVEPQHPGFYHRSRWEPGKTSKELDIAPSTSQFVSSSLADMSTTEFYPR